MLFSFMGLADHFEMSDQPYPYGPIDIFGLSKFKQYLFYPWNLKNQLWVFIVPTSVLNNLIEHKISISVLDEDDAEVLKFDVEHASKQDEEIDQSPALRKGEMLPCVYSDGDWQLLVGSFDISIPKPGRYNIIVKYMNETESVGQINFLYSKADPLQAEEMKAIESDPYSAKNVKVTVGCKECDFNYSIYTALDRNENIEDDSYKWQHDAPEKIICSCGKTSHNLRYIKESLHSVLRQRDLTRGIKLNYTRRYSHKHVIQIVERYFNLLRNEKLENPIQSFLENNLILLSQFHAQKVFIKPKILHKYEADFAIFDANYHLIFIEIERPSLKLFKKDGHPTADLMHAYGQVQDWLNEYANNSAPILENLGLDKKQVFRVSGLVIAGMSRKENEKHLKRHMLVPIYQDIEFMTLDHLGDSLVHLSRELS